MIRVQRVAGYVVLVVIALCAVLASLAFGGGANEPLLSDPGTLVRWGLPITKLLVNLSAAGLIGSLVLACFALSPRKAEYSRALDVGAASAAIMSLSSALTGVFTYLSVTGIPFTPSEQFGAGLGAFISSVPLGQAWLATTLLAALATVLCFAVRNHTAVAFVTVLALVSLVPMAEQGHAADAAGHNQAVAAISLHLVFAAVWIGGLITLVAIRRRLEPGRLSIVIARYSTLAIICFTVVAFSGYISAELRIGTLAHLASAYGILVLVKVAALCALGVFGLLQRRYLIERLERRSGPGTFWWIIAAEMAFMGIASGVAAALARTVTPVTGTLGDTPTPAEILTGQPLPPPPSVLQYVFGWSLDPLWLVLCVFAIFFYIAGVSRLHRGGQRWSALRTASWILGILLLVYVTNGGVALYQQYLFSNYMLVHMVVVIVVPALLVSGAPVSLATQAIPQRRDGSRGGAEWVQHFVHSRVMRVFAHPVVAPAVFIGSLWLFYYSPLFRWSLEDRIGYEVMTGYFLVIGYLFVQSLIGIDPVPYRLPYLFRFALFVVTMAFFSVFGGLIALSHGLMLSNWFGAMGSTWGLTPLEDQHLAGSIAWTIGVIPLLVLAIVVAVRRIGKDAPAVRSAAGNLE